MVPEWKDTYTVCPRQLHPFIMGTCYFWCTTRFCVGPIIISFLSVNETQEKIQSKMKLFADDSIIYWETLSVDSHYILQRDLAQLISWYALQVIKKCAILSITWKRNPILHHFTIFGESLEHVEEYDCLRYTISVGEATVRRSYSKASRTFGLFCCTVLPVVKKSKSKPTRPSDHNLSMLLKHGIPTP